MEAATREALSARLQAGAAALGLPLSALQQRQLIDFIALLAHWNRAYNLTAVRDPLEMVTKHLLDSLAVLPYLEGASLLDLGTGAGLPGIPLAIAAPERQVWLLDSSGKKLRFVRQAVGELGLDNATAVQARLETYRPERNFSTIVSRAVAAEVILPAAQAGLLARPGRLLLMKGRAAELPEGLDQKGFASAHRHRLSVPFLSAPRHLIDLRTEPASA